MASTMDALPAGIIRNFMARLNLNEEGWRL
jgi:hypothetical protein